MTIWDVFELLAGISDVFENWRFYFCLLLSLGMVAGIYWLVPGEKLALILSVIAVTSGLTSGIVWQRRTKRY